MSKQSGSGAPTVPITQRVVIARNNGQCCGSEVATVVTAHQVALDFVITALSVVAGQGDQQCESTLIVNRIRILKVLLNPRDSAQLISDGRQHKASSQPMEIP